MVAERCLGHGQADELGVAEQRWSAKASRSLVSALTDLSRERGCYGAWTVTEEDNVPARATYRRAGGTSEAGQVVFAWDFESGASWSG